MKSIHEEHYHKCRDRLVKHHENGDYMRVVGGAMLSIFTTLSRMAVTLDAIEKNTRKVEGE